jgi:hypothetical protein
VLGEVVGVTVRPCRSATNATGCWAACRSSAMQAPGDRAGRARPVWRPRSRHPLPPFRPDGTRAARSCHWALVTKPPPRLVPGAHPAGGNAGSLSSPAVTGVACRAEASWPRPGRTRCT